MSEKPDCPVDFAIGELDKENSSVRPDVAIQCCTHYLQVAGSVTGHRDVQKGLALIWSVKCCYRLAERRNGASDPAQLGVPGDWSPIFVGAIAGITCRSMQGAKYNAAFERES